MTIDARENLSAFRRFIDVKLADPRAGATRTLTEALDLWEAEIPSPEADPDALAAIREGLADLAAGRTRPARDVLSELRRELNLPGR